MRWVPRLLSHAAAAGRATAGTTANHVRGSNGFATGGGDGPAVPREWLRRLWAEELRKQQEAARRWGRRAVVNAEGGGEDSVGDFAKSARPFVDSAAAAPGLEMVRAGGAAGDGNAPSRSYQYDDRDLAHVER